MTRSNAATKSTTRTYKVRIYGPNLSGQAQQLAQIHVHAADCPECSKYGPRRPYSGETHMARPRNITSKRDAVMYVYEDQINEGSPYDMCAEDVWTGCDCLDGLPEDAPAELPAEPVKPVRAVHDIFGYSQAAKFFAERLRKRFGLGWDALGPTIQLAFVDQEILLAILGQAPSSDHAGAQQHARDLRAAVLVELKLNDA